MHKEFIENNRLILDKIKAKFPNNIKNLGAPLDDPIISPYTYPFIFLADRDPTGHEPNIYTGYAGLILIWENTINGDFSISPDNTADPLVWNKIVTDFNLLDILNGLGWQINTERGHVERISPAFNTPYIPSSTNDTDVTIAISLTSTLLAASTVSFQIDVGSGYVAIAPLSINGGIASTETRSVTVPVPANASYKIVPVTGTNSIVSIYELKR